MVPSRSAARIAAQNAFQIRHWEADVLYDTASFALVPNRSAARMAAQFQIRHWEAEVLYDTASFALPPLPAGNILDTLYDTLRELCSRFAVRVWPQHILQRASRLPKADFKEALALWEMVGALRISSPTSDGDDNIEVLHMVSGNEEEKG